MTTVEEEFVIIIMMLEVLWYQKSETWTGVKAMYRPSRNIYIHL